MNKKGRHTYIFIILASIVILASNSILFYIPNIRGDYSISTEKGQKLQIQIKGNDYLTTSFKNDYWETTENEYHDLIKGTPKREIEYSQTPITNQNSKIVEIVENEDITMHTELIANSSRNLQIRKKYKIKNEFLLRDIEYIYTRIYIDSDFHSYTKEENRLNLNQCRLRLDKPANIKIKYDFQKGFLEIYKQIQEDMKNQDTYTINLNLNLDCG